MADSTFFFYDLETTGFSSSEDRIMQFAGQRTDLAMNPIGEPVNQFIKITPDVIPSPDAIKLTGITPQQTLADGMTEAEFMELFHSEISTPGTIFVGFNSVRFDDEFIRYLNYRNLRDPYEWAYADGRSRWDILDLARMTRALRPDGIKWPFAQDKDGNPKVSNRLGDLSSENGLIHENAHDALSDVIATIEVAKLIYSRQPKLFNFLLEKRSKKEVLAVVNAGKPFVYTSGKYSGEFLNTAIVAKLSDSGNNGVLVYDLRHDPEPFIKMTPEELAEIWKWNPDPEAPRLPVKTLKINRCPAVAPISVITDEETEKRIGTTKSLAQQNLDKLKPHITEFTANLLKAVKVMDQQRDTEKTMKKPPRPKSVDTELYEGGFIPDADKQVLLNITANPEQVADLAEKLTDKRLKKLAPLFVARNFPSKINGEAKQAYEKFCADQLIGGGDTSRVNVFAQRMAELRKQKLTTDEKFALDELELYVESILPIE